MVAFIIALLLGFLHAITVQCIGIVANAVVSRTTVPEATQAVTVVEGSVMVARKQVRRTRALYGL